MSLSSALRNIGFKSTVAQGFGLGGLAAAAGGVLGAVAAGVAFAFGSVALATVATTAVATAAIFGGAVTLLNTVFAMPKSAYAAFALPGLAAVGLVAGGIDYATNAQKLPEQKTAAKIELVEEFKGACASVKKSGVGQLYILEDTQTFTLPKGCKVRQTP